MKVRGLMLGCVALVILAAGCATMKPTPTLYQRILLADQTGVPQYGRAAIALIVDDFVANVVADDRIKGRFAGLKPPDVQRLKTNLSDQICEAVGGPCAYLGRDMKATHTGMKISDTEWTATVEALKKALDKHKIPAKEQGELLALLGPMRADIVGQ